MVFPVVMNGCESWTIKKAEHQTIDAFVLWCWRRLMRVPWTARRSNQSILKEISPEYSMEGLMLKLQYFGHLMPRTDSFEKTLMLGKIEGGRRRTVGQNRPHLGFCPGHNVPLQGQQGSQGCILNSPGESGLVLRGKKGLHSPVDSRRVSLGAHCVA